MSFNQPRPDSSNSSQFRKTGRYGSFSSRNNNYTNNTGKGGGGAAGPPPSSNLQPNRSFSKKSNNAQGGLPRASGLSVNPNTGPTTTSVYRPAPNAPQAIPAPSSLVSGTDVKQTLDQPSQRRAEAVQTAPSSQAAIINPDLAPHGTPTKGDASKSFPIQFGSVSPGTLNVMQIPARTSSAPPNLVEQQQDQARRESQRQAPPFPIPSVPKQQIQRNDVGSGGDQLKTGEAHQILKARKDIQFSSPAPVSQTPKATVPIISGVSRPMPYHQQQVAVQFGGRPPHLQPQPMPMPMPMPLPMGTAPQLPHTVYVSGLHHHAHPMQAQGIIHQGQGFNFTGQMVPQMSHQLGNMGMGTGAQFPQLQPSSIIGSRKPVKITHPQTREELRLENESGPRSHQNAAQPQPVTSAPSSRPINYYSNPPQGPFPLNSSLNPSSQPLGRFGFPVSQVPQTTSSPKTPGLNSSHDVQKAVSSLAPTSVQVTIKPATGKVNNLVSTTSSVEKSLSHKNVESSSIPPQMVTETCLRSSSLPKTPLVFGPSASLKETAPEVALNTEKIKNDTITQSDSMKDQVKKQFAIGSSQPPHQVPGQSTIPSLLSKSPEHTSSSESMISDTSGSKQTNSSNPGLSTADSIREPLPTDRATAHLGVNSHEVGSLEIAEKGQEGSKKYNYPVSSSSLGPDANKNTSTFNTLTSKDRDSNVSKLVASAGQIESSYNITAGIAKSIVSEDGVSPIAVVPSPELTSRTEEESREDVHAGLVPLPVENGKEKLVAELNRSKSSVPKGKKKRKEILQKADAAGTTSDLYNAYKGPEVKKAIEANSEANNSKDELVSEDDIHLSEKDGAGKAELDDWEDAEDISTPKIEIADNILDNESFELMAKKYTRDFLMKFSERCTELPVSFEITSDVADALMVPNVNGSREAYPSPGRVVDRSPGGPRRGVVVGDEDRWNKMPGPLRMDGYGGNFRISQGGNQSVLRNPRGTAPVQYSGGILAGPMQSISFHVGVPRSNSDVDRWHRPTGYQKGLIPSPQTPAPIMHKAERKYQVGIITDEEQAKQRQLKGILNKLTPQNFEKLFEQVKAVNIDNSGTLTGVISQIFDKALMEPTFCEMYANFCYHLAGELPDFSKDNEKITFKILLLNKCQEEFQRGEREQEEAGRDDAEGEVKQSPQEREEKRIQARKRMLGNIRLIGELYKKRMLTERIMHECIKKLLGQYNNSDEEDIESLCKLMSTIGEMIDHPKAKEHMDAYFGMMLRLSDNMKLSSRLRFMLKDAIDLRKNKWQQRRKIEGPKKIDDVHRDAAQERQVQAGRLARGPGSNSMGRSRQPMEFSSRGQSMLPSPTTQMGGYRSLQSQSRGFGVQDARIDDRHYFENRTLSLLRSLGEEAIMLGPQGGLARGMSSRGQPLFPNAPLTETQHFRDPVQRYNMPERFSGPYDQASPLDRNLSFGNRDLRNADQMGNRSRPNSPSVVPTQIVSSEKVWPEERIREMSLSTIKEFYSARDEKEVALCVRDLNSPSFYPTMISLWVSDSFEKKDMERESLAKLLTNLSKSPDSLFNHDHLIKGFQSVLCSLEDAVNDAPKAGEFLGRIFAKIVTEDVISFAEIGQLIFEGGEEQGSLVEVGLAAEVIGTILETVKSEKGEAFLKEICTSAGSKLERFRPPNLKKPLRLDKFI